MAEKDTKPVSEPASEAASSKPVSQPVKDVKDVEEWLTDDDFHKFLAASHPCCLCIGGCMVRIGSWLYFNQFATIALLQKS